jgi:hypothetical protein
MRAAAGAGAHAQLLNRLTHHRDIVRTRRAESWRFKNRA